MAVQHTFPASSFAVARFEDLQEIAQLKADLIDCYKPVNSQELVAIERMALAQQMIFRGARLESGLLTAAMNETLDFDGEPTYFLDPKLVNDDVQITRQQNRNLLVGEGMRRMAAKSDIWTILLRYKAQAERDYRRAVEEFERVKKLRPELPNEPGIGAEIPQPEDIAPEWELNATLPAPPEAFLPLFPKPPCAPRAMWRRRFRLRSPPTTAHPTYPGPRLPKTESLWSPGRRPPQT